ncbi:hypothetical protein CARUB_v10012188mg, partial [Capsella rubella]
MEHSSDLTAEAMMLDSTEASDLDEEEERRPEVLSLIPPYEGKSVLELGAGIDRFIGEVAQKAGEVIALDFIESAIQKNESVNGHYKNVKFMCADVTSPDLKIADGSVELIFSNWLLMYLSDKEVELMAERMLGWVKPGGYIFFRESCFHQSGDSKRKSSPTHYREPRFYTKFFKECQTREASGKSFELSMFGCKCIGAIFAVCWIWQKVSLENDKDFQRFLDNAQYKSSGILRYERVFGEGYVSIGGFVAKMDLNPGQKVLDDFDVHVVGIDLSVNMISFALERATRRDTNLHIQDKPALFRTFFKWLKPGYKVLITDYCRKRKGFDLHDVQAYGKMLKDAGFKDVIANDRTDQ